LPDTTPPRSQEKESYAEIAAHPPASPSAVTATPNSSAIHDLEASQTTKPPIEHRGAIPLLRSVYRERGFLGWYQGLTAQIIKAVLCQGQSSCPPGAVPGLYSSPSGILFVSKDQFESYTWVILTMLARFRARLLPALALKN
jgi:adenine nucleotide transporter 17